MTLISTFPAFAAQLREFIQCHSIPSTLPVEATSETEFNHLAVSLFHLQFARNQPYRRFCEARKATPQAIIDWREIPAMPTAGFKEFELSSIPPEARTQVFHSSGTTEQRPSRHVHNHESLAIYKASLLPWFRTHFLERGVYAASTFVRPPAKRLTTDVRTLKRPEGRAPGHGADAPGERTTNFLILTPSPDKAPHSSLVHMFEVLRREDGSAHSIFTGELDAEGAWNLDFQKTLAALRDSVTAGRPVTLLGTAFNFVQLLDHLAENDQRFRLPPGSCVLETGGYKSRTRVLPKAELHALITSRLNVPPNHIICEYGMSELSSQAYDTTVGTAADKARVFHFPPWARAQIINPETRREAADAETGLIRVFDLANVYSVMAIQTEDLGVRRGNGFELLGRAALAETRGCSLMSI